jgi:hypothetical protein
MKAHYKKAAAALALAVALSAGLAGVATNSDGAGNSLKRAVSYGNSLR